jgi:hypothetical protein
VNPVRGKEETPPVFPLDRRNADLIKADMETLGNAFVCRGRRLDPAKMVIQVSLYNTPVHYIYDGLPLDSSQVEHRKTDPPPFGIQTLGWGVPPAFKSLRQLATIETATLLADDGAGAENRY